MNYSEKLRDPRWQKKRLEILQRDNWCCQACRDSKNTLHVHHMAYMADDPWDEDPLCLITICEACHSKIHCGNDAIEMVIIFKLYFIIWLRQQVNAKGSTI